MTIITITSYILIPLIISGLYRVLNLKRLIVLTHILTALVIFILPFYLLKLDYQINPSKYDGLECGNPIIGMYAANIMIMVPITQGLLVLFNYIFKNR